MLLASGTILELTPEKLIYNSEHKTVLTSLLLNNEGTTDIKVDIFIQYANTINRIIPKETILSIIGTKMYKLDVNYTLGRFEKILIAVNSESDSAILLSYIFEGEIIPATQEEIIYNNIYAALKLEFDARYYLQSDTVPGETMLSQSDEAAAVTFEGQKFVNYNFNYHVATLEFIDCIFGGVCKIKNTYGTIDHTNSIGGYVISNKAIPETLIGVGDVSADNF